MKSLAALVALTAVTLLATADLANARVPAPVRGSGDVIVVMGPFPLEVFDGSDSDTADRDVSRTLGYVNLGFVEVDTAAGSAWPYGFGALFDRAQQRAVIDARPGSAG